VDKVTFVGKPRDPFAPGDYIGPSSLSVLWRLDIGKISRDKTELTQGHALISVNSDNVVESVSAGGLPSCCMSAPGQTPSPVRLCLGRSQSEQQFRVLSTCSRNFAAFLNPLVQFPLSYGQGLRLDSKNFTDSFQIYADAESKRRCARTELAFETDCCSALDFEDTDAQVSFEQKRINEQTARIATKYLHWILWRKKEPKLEHKEFIFVELGRRIIGQVCPEKDLPDRFLSSALYLFRLILTETMEHSPFVKHFDRKRHAQVLDSLRSCLEIAQKSPRMKINWDSQGSCPPKVNNQNRNLL